MNMKLFNRWLALAMAVVMCFGLVQPVAAQAADTSGYQAFLADLKVLEGYADAYAAANSGKVSVGLVINYIRTGVEKYTTDTWTTMAGPEETGFTAYVAEQDAANGTTASNLRDLEEFYTPNGQFVEFEHMFGAMNMAYTNSRNADLGSWAGDLCDLICFTKGNLTSTELEAMVAEVRQSWLGVDDEQASGFGMQDIWGDLDAYYLMAQTKNGFSISAAMESYYTASLSDSDRAAYFLNNRFAGVLTKENVRNAIFNAYSNDLGVSMLESSEGITEADAQLREACCYAFADHLYELAEGRLDGPSEETTTPSDPSSDPSQPTTEPAEPSEPDKEMDNEFYSVFSSTSSTLAPGITQSINYAITADDKQIVYYVATVDVTRKDVTIMANYRNNDPSQGWGMQRVEDQAKALLERHSNPDNDLYIENLKAVVATNADGYNMSTGKPGGLLVMEGTVWHPIDGDGFFAILKDGSAVIGTKDDYELYKDQIQEGIGAFGATLIKDGKININKSSNYYNSRASRTAIGITADGKVVMMVLDGRQEPFSAGGSMEEIAQIMLDAGCVTAVNLDGGGSSTYLSKPEGSDSLQLVNRPSDGYARSVSTSLVAISTAKSSNEFEYAKVDSNYDYLTPGTTLQMSASGVSATGNSAAVPENAVWQVSDAAVGTIDETGLFTAADIGTVEVQLTVDGVVVGTKTLHVVIPDAVGFEKESMNLIFGVPTELPVVASYNGNPVAISESDVELLLTDENAGTFDGFVFTADEEACIRSVQAVAFSMLSEEEIYGIMNLKIYKDGEAVFDFDNITAGDRQLAWDRDVSNSTTSDNAVYYINDVNDTMEISYVFGLDMESIEVPDKLKDLTYMLPGSDAGSTAWDFLLNLAERVSTMTEVIITVQFDPNLDVDCSEMTVVNEYFALKSAVLDETTNVMTMTCSWIDQTQAIDPATANPICILSGIKATPKTDAWEATDRLNVVNSGEVSYNIYLRASALYGFAQKVENQEKYDLYPFVNPDLPSEKGASFGSTYAKFEDKFTLDKTVRQGWYSFDSNLFYYVDNVPVTGVQCVPGYEDPSVNLYYEFGEDGSCSGTITGMFEMNGNKYYAIQGVLKYGWKSVFDQNGQSGFYYFHPYMGGAAVNGECNVEGYNYLFEDYKCVRGEIVKDSKGIHYRFAGNWVMNQWVEVDGNYYFARYMTGGYFVTDGLHSVRTLDGSGNRYHLFDENGVWQKDYSGLYHVGEDTYLIKDGLREEEAGLVYVDGYYYYFCSTAKAVKNCTYWPSKTNGLLPIAAYEFDEQGRMINPPVTEPEEPDVTDPIEPSEPTEPSNPTQPSEPAEKKTGIFAENGGLYLYYEDEIQYNLGLIELDGDYYYVRSNGRLATGPYWITNTNGLMPRGRYEFDTETGKMLNPPSAEEPEDTKPTDPSEPEESTPSQPTEPAKNGIVAENGALYYYKDGKIQFGAGLIQLDGDYYYIRSNGQAAVGNYWVTKHNDLLPLAMYTFGEDGKMIVDGTETPDEPTQPENPEVLDGIVEKNGALFYYKDGQVAYCAGLVKLVDEDGVEFYIYVRSNGRLAIGKYWVTNNNGLLSQQEYVFDANGRYYPPVTEEPDETDPSEPSAPTEPEEPTPSEPSEPEVLNGIVDVNGTLYYYKDGNIAYGAGLLKLTDDAGVDFYIYVRSNGQLATGKYWPTTTNGLLPTGMYDFGTNGRYYQ